MQDATRQGKILSLFLVKRKENCTRKRGGGEKEGSGRGKVFDLFQRYYKLSECSYYWYIFLRNSQSNHLAFFLSNDDDAVPGV